MEQRLHVFIDTNVFLGFFSYTNDDIEQLQQLVTSVKTGEMRLYMTRQVADEFAKNRETKIKSSLDAIRKLKVISGLPRLVQDYPAFADYQKGVSILNKAIESLLRDAESGASEQGLAADVLFNSLQDAAGIIEIGGEVLEAARRRRDIGNPPGKNNSLGDQINWEALLRNVDDGVDLHVVSKDGDFTSAISEFKPHQYLADEWRQRKKGELSVHLEIKILLKNWFPSIKLRMEKEKAIAVAELKSSLNFSATHNAIAKLNQFVDLLTVGDIQELAYVAQQNNQVSWIAADPDVLSFYRNILGPNLTKLPADLASVMRDMFKLSVSDL